MPSRVGDPVEGVCAYCGCWHTNPVSMRFGLATPEGNKE